MHGRNRRDDGDLLTISDLNGNIIQQTEINAGNWGTIFSAGVAKSGTSVMVYPTNSLSYVENYLKMTFGHITEEYECDPVISDAMNKLLILHADHEQNCSASTVRMVGSSHANLYASISGGIAALWGPLHGGANQQV